MKRKLSLTLSAVTLAGTLLTACGADTDANTTEVKESPATSAGANTPAPKANAEKKQVEIFSWWTGAGEEAGLQGLIKLFKEKHPDIEVINAAVAGGAGTNAKAVLASRMQGGDPPSSFQVHGGAELNTGWVAADKVSPLNDLYDSEAGRPSFRRT